MFYIVKNSYEIGFNKFNLINNFTYVDSSKKIILDLSLQIIDVFLNQTTYIVYICLGQKYFVSFPKEIEVVELAFGESNPIPWLLNR